MGWYGWTGWIASYPCYGRMTRTYKKEDTMVMQTENVSTIRCRSSPFYRYCLQTWCCTLNKRPHPYHVASHPHEQDIVDRTKNVKVVWVPKIILYFQPMELRLQWAYPIELPSQTQCFNEQLAVPIVTLNKVMAHDQWTLFSSLGIPHWESDNIQVTMGLSALTKHLLTLGII